MFCHHETKTKSKKSVHISKLKFDSLSLLDSKSDTETGSKTKNGKVQSAFLLSDIDRIESLGIWKFREIKMHLSRSKEFAHSEKAFAIFITDRISPIIVICASKDEMLSWMDAFRVCITGQKSKALGKSRTSVTREGVVFGINNTRRLRSSASERIFGGSVDWDEDSVDWDEGED